ncbi:unnamed protein product [Urochloa humidicola]
MPANTPQIGTVLAARDCLLMRDEVPVVACVLEDEQLLLRELPEAFGVVLLLLSSNSNHGVFRSGHQVGTD